MKIILIPDESTGRSSKSLSEQQVRKAAICIGLVIGLSLTGSLVSGGIAWHKSQQLKVAMAMSDSSMDSAVSARVGHKDTGLDTQNMPAATERAAQDQSALADLAQATEQAPTGRAAHEAAIAAKKAALDARNATHAALTDNVKSRDQSVHTLMEAAAELPLDTDPEQDRVLLVAQAIGQMRGQLRNYQKLIDDVRGQNEAKIEVVGTRMGQLQAHLMRLNALGSRLTSIAQLADGEFDFGSEPAVGGVEPNIEVIANQGAMVSTLDDLESSLKRHSQQLNVLEALIRDRELEKESYPAIWPADGGWISSNYGKRRDPFSGRRAMHRGMDIAGRKGSYITSAAAGVVTHAGKSGNYGLLVEVNHGNGYVTRYGHCQEVLVKVGEKVEKGGAIAKMGSTGRSTGTHLHFEVLFDGKHQDPRKFLQGTG